MDGGRLGRWGEGATDPVQAGEDGRGLRKKCCHSPSGSPVIPPPDDIEGDQLGKVSQPET